MSGLSDFGIGNGTYGGSDAFNTGAEATSDGGLARSINGAVDTIGRLGVTSLDLYGRYLGTRQQAQNLDNAETIYNQKLRRDQQALNAAGVQQGGTNKALWVVAGVALLGIVVWVVKRA
ncbi:MAG: hypothetical protein NVS9B2_27960 [Steroidobacteraceae bacterium]